MEPQKKIKNVIAKCLRKDVATVMKQSIECTGCPRTISEVVDKMKPYHQVNFICY